MGWYGSQKKFIKIIKKWAWMEALLFSGVNGSLAFPIKRFVAAVDDLDEYFGVFSIQTKN